MGIFTSTPLIANSNVIWPYQAGPSLCYSVCSMDKYEERPESNVSHERHNTDKCALLAAIVLDCR